MALPTAWDQGDVTTQNLSSLLDSAPSTWDPGILFPNGPKPALPVWTTSLDTSSWEQTTLPVCTPLGPQGDYLWSWGRSWGVQAGVAPLSARSPSQRAVTPEVGRHHVQKGGVWTCRCGLALSLRRPVTVHKLRTLCIFVTHRITPFIYLIGFYWFCF